MPVIMVVVQAAVWTTLGCGLYLLWMNGRETSSLATFSRAYNLNRVLGALRDLWAMIGLALILLLLLAVIIPLLEMNASIPTSCITLPPQGAAVSAVADSTAMICAQTPPTNPTDPPHSGPDYSSLGISPG